MTLVRPPPTLRRLSATVLAVIVATIVVVAPVPAGAEVRHVKVASFDGTRLDGWIHLPDHAVGPVPVVLMLNPYWGQPRQGGVVEPTPEDLASLGRHPVRRLFAEGYAVALFNVRGSGNSEGCLDFFGATEERDAAHLVQWLGAQPWSNGRVGMYGISYAAGTAQQALVQRAPALRAAVIGGVVSDFYLINATPQGALFPVGSLGQLVFPSPVSLAPPVGGSPQHATAEHAPTVPGRICGQTADSHRVAVEDLSGARPRDADYYAPRRRLHRFGTSRAGVLFVHGLDDWAHTWQEDGLWRALGRTPKRMLIGPWGHEVPDVRATSFQVEGFHDQVVEWFDHFLKGAPEPPQGLGTAEFYERDGTRHTASRWPPPGRAEALYLSGDRLAATPAGAAARTFRSTPVDAVTGHVNLAATALAGAAPPLPPPCPGEDGDTRLTWTGPALAGTALLAGDPFAYLRLSSDRPAGLIGVALYALPPDGGCDAARLLATGAADLRYHTGGYSPKAFPTGGAQQVRIDLSTVVERIPAGHRLALVAGHPRENVDASPVAAQLTVHAGTYAAASHVVLPVVQGSAGGTHTSLRYPPRPFGPEED